MKNKIITVILVLVMLIPSVVAIINYSIQQGGEADSHNTIKLTMTDTAGNVYVFDRGDGMDMINYFLDIPADSVSIGVLPSTIEAGAFYQIVLTTAVKDFGYKYYFTQSAADCYYMAGDGSVYKIGEETADTFLNGKYSACIYENGLAPGLTVSGQACVADSASWNFKNAKGEFVAADTSAMIKNETESLSLEGGIAMNFSVEPDSLALKITDSAGGNVIFDDEYENIAGLTVSDSMNVKIEATAKWYEDAERNYFGEQSYVFNAALSAPARFNAGATSVQIGEFICVTGENIGNVDNITFTSEPSIDYTPVFYKDGDKAHALIPFNWNLAAGEYTLGFSYGGSSQEIKIALTARDNPFRDSSVTIANATVNSFGTDDARTKCEEALLSIAKTGDENKYWSGSFLTGIDGSVIVGGFGHNYKVSGTDITYRHTGVDYRANEGSDVKAVNNGKVVYAGYLDYSGYTVVIEHGWGLKSWYAHMSKASTEVGADVNKGDVIGSAGSSGFISGSGAHIGMTVFDVPVCQYALWDDGSRKGVPVFGE